MKKYCSYHDDGRLHQELVKHYEDGNLYLTSMQQYDFTENSKEAVVTIWEYNHLEDKLETDSVVCVMSREDSELYCNGLQGNPLAICGITELHNGMKMDYIMFYGGEQVKD